MESQDEPIRLSDVGGLLGHPVHRVTVHRWCKLGVGGIRLKHCRVGGRLYTSARYVAEFNAAINATSGGTNAQSA